MSLSVASQREAILIVADNNSGIGERSFREQLINKADGRFDSHLDRLQDEGRTR